ncbi:hypothetical protein SODALDRAFT_334588 [Sodiomyces alkalinus F11]|uniref:DNA-directed RNA polymerase subunit n=1 Tax=Sodiomyces alkalinus (strain CBS 110278 / VKM F-3762 / F11) TaxID=1314773 RepID=A0A3N2PSJ8_SODAK|nr:hypothetical protein SODALDRAFT_334588 [Sodiomyces alkalinus F11]ROT37485.1 hypothetical protein SODALDRAFT_334588 [Sodiomyces alkalinus F11]
MAPVEETSPAIKGDKSDKTRKKEKSEKKGKKKRTREDDAEAGHETGRKHKRSKSTVKEEEEAEDSFVRGPSPDLSAAAPASANDSSAPDDETSAKKKKGKEKRHKKHRSKADDESDHDAVAEVDVDSTKKSKKKKKKRERQPSPDLAEAAPAATQDKADLMDVDAPSAEPQPHQSTSRLHQPPDAPSDPQFPFFTQTVSLYLPLYPIGWAEPRTAAATQHLEPMLNRYVPVLKGVLLAFRNVRVSDQPGRRDDGDDEDDGGGSDMDSCEVASIDEYAVGFGWVTVEVDLFVPKRGAWMEGSINLQSEGHVGVVCWGKFNASIESARLPPEWRWVHLGSDEANEAGNNNMDDSVSNYTAEEQHGAVRQIHATGYWVDGTGSKVKGRVRFRIKSFDVGITGDHGYLSLEGTMLDAAGEAEAVQQDVQQELRRRRGKSGGILVKERRMVPEFSVTKFGHVEDEEEALRQDVWKTTEPAADTPATSTVAFAGISNDDA